MGLNSDCILSVEIDTIWLYSSRTHTLETHRSRSTLAQQRKVAIRKWGSPHERSREYVKQLFAGETKWLQFSPFKEWWIQVSG